MNPKIIDITGQKFNRLTVIEYYKQDKNRCTLWKCKCDCGKIVIVRGVHLKNGHTKSCGCYAKETTKQLNYKNGLSNTRLYYTYRNMLNRCYRDKDINHKYYKDKGIRVDAEWLGKDGFINFSNWALNNGYNEKLTLDRIDNNKNYCPENCRWVDRYVQANNKTNNYYLIVNGIKDTVGNHARNLGISYWNLLHYAKGGKNCKYPDLKIEVVNE